MPVPDCVVLVKEMTNVLSQDEEVRALLRAGASHNEIMEKVLAKISPEERETAFLAFSELPRSTLQMIVRSWASAEKAGKQFRLESLAPVDREAFIEKRRVRLILDYDEDGVTMSLCHVAGSHAEWYAPAAPSQVSA